MPIKSFKGFAFFVLYVAAAMFVLEKVDALSGRKLSEIGAR